MDTSLLDAIDALRQEVRDAAIAQIAGQIYAAKIMRDLPRTQEESVDIAKALYHKAER